MQQPVKPTYEFGPFRLDPEKRVLLKDGEQVPLTPKALEVLLLLVENHDHVVAKDEFWQCLWPDSFVEEGTLTVNISTLRKALGENRGEHRYIVTVPGRGYRFVADVREVWVLEEHLHARVVIEQKQEEQTIEPSSLLDEPADDVPWLFSLLRLLRLKRLWRVLVLSLVLLCLAAIGLIWARTTRPIVGPDKDGRGSLKLIQIAEPKSGRKESMNNGKLSPDGNLIVFSATGEGMNLWIRQIDGGQPYQVTKGSWYDDAPIWSPDGHRIAFMSNRNNQIGIWTVPFLSGEPPRLLKTLEDSATVLKGDTGLLRWTKGNKIYFSWKDNVYLLDVASNDMTPLTSFDPATATARQFSISSDEEWIAYVDKQDGQFDIWRVSLHGGAPVRVTSDAMIEQNPLWHPDGKRLIYTALLEGQFRIYQVYLDGRPPEFIHFTEDESHIWDVADDGTKLLYYGRRYAADLWQVDLETKEDIQLTSDLGLEFWLQPSADSQSIAFQALQGENIVWDPWKSALLVEELSSSGQTTRLATNVFETQWSPDGEFIAFLREADGICNLWTTRAVGGEERQLTSEGVIFGPPMIGPPFNRLFTRDFCWSPQSNRIAYCSKKGGAPNLWVVSVDNATESKISNNTDKDLYVTCPIWSPDGERIAYVTNTGGLIPGERQTWRLWVTDLKKSEMIFETNSIIRLLGWTSSGTELAVALVAAEGMNRVFPTAVTLSRLSVDEHRRVDLAHLDSAYFANIYLSPDGRNISYVSTYKDRDDIWVLPVEGGAPRSVTANPDPKTYYSSLAWSSDGKRIYYGKQASWSLIKMIDNFR